jgi:hypothetical protein
MGVYVVRAFVQLRELLSSNKELTCRTPDVILERNKNREARPSMQSCDPKCQRDLFRIGAFAVPL